MITIATATINTTRMIKNTTALIDITAMINITRVNNDIRLLKLFKRVILFLCHSDKTNNITPITTLFERVLF